MKTETLAKRLFYASRRAMRRHDPHIWGQMRIEQWKYLPSESIEVWNEVAEEAKTSLKTEK